MFLMDPAGHLYDRHQGDDYPRIVVLGRHAEGAELVSKVQVFGHRSGVLQGRCGGQGFRGRPIVVMLQSGVKLRGLRCGPPTLAADLLWRHFITDTETPSPAGAARPLTRDPPQPRVCAVTGADTRRWTASSRRPAMLSLDAPGVTQTEIVAVVSGINSV